MVILSHVHENTTAARQPIDLEAAISPRIGEKEE
jgi:hypothetical protein